MPGWLAPNWANLPQIDQSQKIAVSGRGSLLSAKIRAIFCARGVYFRLNLQLKLPRNRPRPIP
jgi:hypothetical protein